MARYTEKMAHPSHEAAQPPTEGDSIKESSHPSRISTSSCVTLKSDEPSRAEKTPTPEPTTPAPSSNGETVLSNEDDSLRPTPSAAESSGHLGANIKTEQSKDRGQSQRLSLTIPTTLGEGASA